MTRRRASLALLCAAIPVAALSVAIPFVNRDDPHVLGMPFLLAWIVAWVLSVPAWMWAAYRLLRDASTT
ncbi:MAG TPA: DUF3311 domain-containing protein [Candidatus Eremiobacteraceae bacterium]|nr:DUF3311 domain-containing protein [Candidatus Eremiobacteraceae bacterium]